MSGNDSSISDDALQNLRESVESSTGEVQEPDEPRPGEQFEDPFGIEDRVTGPGDTGGSEPAPDPTPEPEPAPEPSQPEPEPSPPEPPETGAGGIPTGPTVGNQGTPTEEQTTTDPAPPEPSPPPTPEPEPEPSGPISSGSDVVDQPQETTGVTSEGTSPDPQTDRNIGYPSPTQPEDRQFGEGVTPDLTRQEAAERGFLDPKSPGGTAVSKVEFLGEGQPTEADRQAFDEFQQNRPDLVDTISGRPSRNVEPAEPETQEQAETQVVNEFLRNNPFLERGDVTTETTDTDDGEVIRATVEGGEDVFNQEFRDAITDGERGLTGTDLDQQLGAIDLRPSDVAVSDGEVSLTEGAQTRLTKQRNAERFDEQFGNVNITPADIRVSDGEVSLASDAQRQVTAQRFDEQFGSVDVTPSDLVAADGSASGFELGLQTQKAVAAENIDQQIQDRDIAPSDIIVAGGEVGLRDVTQRQIAAQDFSEDVPGEFAASDVVLTGEGPQLDIQAQRETIAAREGVETEAVTRTPEGFTVERGPPAIDPDTAAAATLIGGTTERQREVTEQLPELPTREEQRQQAEQRQQIQQAQLGEDIATSGQVTDAPSARQVDLAEAGPTGAAGLQLSEGAQQVFGGIQEEFVQEPQETLAEPVEAVTGAPGEIERTLGSAAFEVGEASGELATTIQEQSIEPAAEVVGAAVEGDIQSQEDILGILATGPEGEQVIQADEPPAPTETEGVVTEQFLTGVGTGVTEATVGAPQEAVELGALAAEGGEFAAQQIEQEGVVEGTEETVVAGAQFGETVARQTAQQAQQQPAQFGGALVGGLFGGTVTGRVTERATTGARLRFEGRSGPDIDAEATTRQPETLETGEQPEFETPTDAPTEQAVREVETRAAEQPPELQEATGSEQVLLRTETQQLPGDLEVQEGQFELPGLFASPDFAPLRFAREGEGTSLRPRLPDIFGRPERATAIEAPEIEGMPRGAGESGFALRETETGEMIETDVPQGEAAARAEAPGVERTPDPTTAGFEFLTEQGERGTAFVRPTGDRTPELEAVFPPETRFERVSTGTIEAGGTRGTLDIFRRVEDQPDAPDADADITGETFTASEITQRSRRGGTPEGQPISPLGVTPDTGTTTPTETTTPTSPTGTTPTTTGPTGTSLFGEPTTTTPTTGVETTTPTARTDVTVRDGTQPTEPTGTTPTEPSQPTGPFGGPTGTSPTPSGEPTGPFGTPTTPPSGPTGGPTGPTGTPSGPPETPTGPPSGGPPTGGPPTGGPPGGGPPALTPPGLGGGGGPFGFGGSPPDGPPQQPPRRPRTDDDDSDREDEPFFAVVPTGQEFQNPVASGAAFLGIGSGRQADFGGTVLPGGEAAPTDQQDIENRRGVSLFGSETL